ncbi:response regulator transcription factor [Fredinandcohnia sp. 179-A 10B2 NHS]|uniref:response regulator transcription factor n=1 Tax=Fredinandcohnia sp. 179-A 10B2 NHS TaxID=3235176 RepID=UPI0039A18A67
MSIFRVLLADDHPTFRTGLASLVNNDKTFEVVGEAGSGDEVISIAKTLQPDVVIMDIQMPGINGIEATRQITTLFPNVRILVMTMFEDDQTVAAAMRAGARGYVLKGALPNEIIRAIQAVAAGEAIFSERIAKKFINYFEQFRLGLQAGELSELTVREREILNLIARGYKNAEIANLLVLSPSTVRNHITSILSKLQVADRAEAIKKAKDAGMG